MQYEFVSEKNAMEYGHFCSEQIKTSIHPKKIFVSFVFLSSINVNHDQYLRSARFNIPDYMIGRIRLILIVRFCKWSFLNSNWFMEKYQRYRLYTKLNMQLSPSRKQFNDQITPFFLELFKTNSPCSINESINK